MNNKKEPIKDFLYNSIDFLLIIIIVAAVVGIISWRINIMFDSSNKELVEEDINDSKDLSDNKNSNEEPINNIDKSEEDGGSETKDDEGKNLLEKDKAKDKIVNFTIPKGSVTTDIAQLLKDAKLIENPDDFISKCEDMNLSRSLKSGDFEIPSNSSIEEILKIITK